jgi:transcriptional regulator with XRE-family HTH domain
MTKTIHSSEYKEITESLKKARIEAGLTQIEAAAKIGKPQSYISKVENGEQRIDVVELKELATLYGKKASYFI